jgi:hypothetical protein
MESKGEAPAKSSRQNATITTTAQFNSEELPHRNKRPYKKKADVNFIEEAEAETIQDRQQRGVAALLTRFKYLIDLAATPVEDGATKEVAAANAFRMEVESSALVCLAKSCLRDDTQTGTGSRR